MRAHVFGWEDCPRGFKDQLMGVSIRGSLRPARIDRRDEQDETGGRTGGASFDDIPKTRLYAENELRRRCMAWTVSFLDERVESEMEAQPGDIRAQFDRLREIILGEELDRFADDQ